MQKPTESTCSFREPKKVSVYQQFAPAGAGDFITNVSIGSEFVKNYQTEQYVMVDITEQARQKGVPIGRPTFSVFKKAI